MIRSFDQIPMICRTARAVHRHYRIFGEVIGIGNTITSVVVEVALYCDDIRKGGKKKKTKVEVYVCVCVCVFNCVCVTLIYFDYGLSQRVMCPSSQSYLFYYNMNVRILIKIESNPIVSPE